MRFAYSHRRRWVARYAVIHPSLAVRQISSGATPQKCFRTLKIFHDLACVISVIWKDCVPFD